MAKTSIKVKSRRKPKFAIRKKNRCALCGRPRAYMRFFNICRLCFRKMAIAGKLPGIGKSSW